MKDFATLMLEKYPDLFPKDKDGKPTYPACGFYCPPGWETIVDTALSGINYCVRQPRTQQTWIRWYKVNNLIWHAFTYRFLDGLYQVANPIPRNALITVKRANEIRAQYPKRLKLSKMVSWVMRKMRPKWRYKYIPCPPVTIAQVKEKFGTLRIYVDGGDCRVNTIVSFAEAITEKVCEETGQPGNRVTRGGWCKVLSSEQAKKFGYK